VVMRHTDAKPLKTYILNIVDMLQIQSFHTKLLSENSSGISVLEKQVHSCRSEDALAQKRCEINAEGRGDGSKKKLQKSR
jgi:hypothetical protein